MRSALEADKHISISFKQNWFTLTLFAIGFCFIVLQFVSNLTGYLKAPFMQVNHPLHFKFTTYNQLLNDSVKGDLIDYAQLKRSTKLNEAISELEHVCPDRLANPKD